MVPEWDFDLYTLYGAHGSPGAAAFPGASYPKGLHRARRGVPALIERVTPYPETKSHRGLCTQGAAPSPAGGPNRGGFSVPGLSALNEEPGDHHGGAVLHGDAAGVHHGRGLRDRDTSC